MTRYARYLVTIRDFINRRPDDLRAFLRAYHKTQQWIDRSSADEIVDVIQEHFPDVDRSVLVEAVAGYKRLGTWSTSPIIPRVSYERAADMALASPDLTGVTQRYAYEQCCDDSFAREVAGS